MGFAGLQPAGGAQVSLPSHGPPNFCAASPTEKNSLDTELITENIHGSRGRLALGHVGRGSLGLAASWCSWPQPGFVSSLTRRH